MNFKLYQITFIFLCLIGIANAKNQISLNVDTRILQKIFCKSDKVILENKIYKIHSAIIIKSNTTIVGIIAYNFLPKKPTLKYEAIKTNQFTVFY